jgi:hypothetical protein
VLEMRVAGLKIGPGIDDRDDGRPCHSSARSPSAWRASGGRSCAGRRGPNQRRLRSSSGALRRACRSSVSPTGSGAPALGRDGSAADPPLIEAIWARRRPRPSAASRWRRRRGSRRACCRPA